jgi:hypothetical protein
MVTWIIILSFWIAFLSLILHDATKDDGDGSAISAAAKRLGAFLDWTKESASKPSSNAKTAVGNTSSFPEPIRPGTPPEIERAPAARKKKSWRKGGRVSATIPELELAIAEAVKKAGPECEEFVGVVLQQTTPRSRLDANWGLRGVKFGKADRTMATETLRNVIERMQREYYLSEH